MPKRWRNLPAIILGACLAVSAACNGYQFFSGNPGGEEAFQEPVLQTDANSRDTYFTIHHVREAQALGKGEGVKVGVIDAYFDLDGEAGLYAGGNDFSGEPDGLHKQRSHGWQMATVLREIAPECEIYALNISHESDARRVESIIDAMEWAGQNGLEVLTLSQAQVPEQYRPAFHEAIDRALERGIVTCFIHCDHPGNILPYSVTPYMDDYSRAPDVNVYHYDYNTIWPDQLRAYQNRTAPPESGDDMPFFSYSSMSPVTAGFVAILKSIDPTLSPAEYKQLLVDTSYPMEYVGVMEWESGTSEHTVDIAKAARTLWEGVAG